MSQSVHISNSIGFHDCSADNLSVKARVDSSSGAYWASLDLDNHSLNFFAASRSEAEAILIKIRAAIDVALGETMLTGFATSRMEAALQQIADSPLGDQPAASPGTSYDWACRHIGKLRRVALAALGAERAEAA
jgi:hypothetical protein